MVSQVTSRTVLSVLAALSVGCNLILGMDEGQPRPSGGGGGTGTGGEAAGGDPSSGGACSGNEGGAPTDTEWGCLGSVRLLNECDDDVNVDLKFSGEDLANHVVTLTPCAHDDTFCFVATGEELSPDPATGDLIIPTAPGFSDYYEVDGLFWPYKATILELGPLTNLPQVQREVPLFTQAALDEASMGAELGGKGMLLLGAFNCRGDPAAGVRFAVQGVHADRIQFYFVSSFGVLDISTEIDETDLPGAGGFLNLDSGLVTVQAFRASDNAQIGEAEVLIRDNTVTYLHLGPTPL